ncbi:MAG: 5'/3'-nucleotidase SurE [Calditrichia bacterium]
MSKKPLILVSNDDGIQSPGILALARAMQPLGDTRVIAPDKERSAVGHAITISHPLRAKEFERGGNFFGHAIDGTPADCVKLGVKAILEREPDLVVSGINHGANTGINVHYSGTVSAAKEGTILGIPSIAFSMTHFRHSTDMSVAEEVATIIAAKVLEHGLPEGTVLNVNIPPVPREEIRGIKITEQGKGRFEEAFEKRIDPMNRTYYWLGGSKLTLDTDEKMDDVATTNSYVSVTPLHYDLTHRKMIPTLEKWNLSF